MSSMQALSDVSVDASALCLCSFLKKEPFP